MNKIMNALKNWWTHFNMSAEELYLSQSTNEVDLEHRMRQIMTPSDSNKFSGRFY